jgi:glycosyltransferase involved in cell wall biosynthesis
VLISLLPVRNGAEDLPRHLASAASFADAVIALDDGSTDDTRQILQADPFVKVMLTNPRRDSYQGWDDAGNRNRLLEAAAELNPSWVLFLDADEAIPDEDGSELRNFLRGDAIPGLAYGLVHHRMWGDTHYSERVHWIYRLFAWRPGLELPTRRLHFNPVPDSIPKHLWIRTTIRVQHFGAATERHLVARQQKYQEADPDDEFRTDRAGLDQRPDRLVPWTPRPADLAILWAGRAADQSPSSARGETPTTSIGSVGSSSPSEPTTAPRPEIACLLPARNAERDLPGWFDSVRRFADVVVALDDGSTDDTRHILQADPLVKVMLTNPRRDSYQGWDDAGNRNRLLEAASALRPHWIMFLDADERLDEADAQALYEFVKYDAMPGFAYGFKVLRMVGGTEVYDASSTHVEYRLFAFEPGQQLLKTRLHLVPVPTSVPRRRWLRTSLRIQHLGGSTTERRAARYAKYEEADPRREFQSDYSHLLSEPTHVAHWETRPPGLPVLELSGSWEEPPDDPLDLPVLSAVIIAHDDESTIASSVRAVVDQEVPVPFQVIVVTSGRDRTAGVVREQFPDVVLIELEGTALPGRARNAGLRVALGEYVSFPGSHVELLPGSLAARIEAHDKGYAMVTGTTLNGNPSWAGTAAYFLDNSSVLPTRPSVELGGPPAHCSYRRDLLEDVGGFREDLRTAEDTAVNSELWRRGYNAYRAQNVWLVHRSPCNHPVALVRHYFSRGRGTGRVFLESPRGAPRRLSRAVRLVVLYVPNRLRSTSLRVRTWGDDYTIGIYRLVKPLVVLSVLAEWWGICVELGWHRLRHPWGGRPSVPGLRGDPAGSSGPDGSR